MRRLARPTALAAPLVTIVALCASGCESEPDELFPIVFGGDRPSRIYTPSDYDPDRAAPLVIALHGYGNQGGNRSDGDDLGVLDRLDLVELVDEEYVILTAPDGTIDSQNRRFWNGTDACCDFDGSGVDDVSYLVDLIDGISTEWNIDLERVVLIGFSGGGFMAYGAACARADRFSAVVSVAGATYADFDDCQPSEVVDILQIHGDEDPAIAYAGDAFQPGAEGTTLRWAGYNGCAQVPVEQAERLDLDGQVEGSETRIDTYLGCPPDGRVELWTAEGSGHDLDLGDSFRAAVWGWLEGADM